MGNWNYHGDTADFEEEHGEQHYEEAYYHFVLQDFMEMFRAMPEQVATDLEKEWPMDAEKLADLLYLYARTPRVLKR